MARLSAARLGVIAREAWSGIASDVNATVARPGRWCNRQHGSRTSGGRSRSRIDAEAPTTCSSAGVRQAVAQRSEGADQARRQGHGAGQARRGHGAPPPPHAPGMGRAVRAGEVVSDAAVREVALKIIRWGIDEARERDAMWEEADNLLFNQAGPEFSDQDTDRVRLRIEAAIDAIVPAVGPVTADGAAELTVAAILSEEFGIALSDDTRLAVTARLRAALGVPEKGEERLAVAR